ncbi:MAG TPA: adenylate kinase [Candidatus Thermoplasmatota archaeon]|nr:adenylate kinase [Candidatus Thermoplasmatota archaeon]
MGAVVITGVPGVGKSTVINLAKQHTGYEVVVYGDEMIKVAVAQGLAKDRDEMRRLDPVVQRRIQEAAAESIAARGDVIVDTHCTIKTPKGYLPGLPEWVARKLKLKQIILVEATPDEIHHRRAEDKTRNRDADSPDLIAEHQAMNRAMAMSVAVLTGATVHIVRNNEGRQDEAKNAVLKALS